MTKEELNGQVNVWIKELKMQELADGTLRNYRPIVQRFIDWIPEDCEISKELVMDFKEYLTKELGATSTRNHNIVVVDKFLKWLGHQDCTVKIFRIQRRQSNEEIITIAEYKKMMRKAKEIGDFQTYNIMKILVMTGIRVGELKFFTVENLDDYYIDVTNKGKERKIIMRQDLRRDLKKYAKEQGIKKGFLFPSPVNDGKMVSDVTIWRRMKKLAGLAKVKKKKVHAHSFRHLFAQIYMSDGGNFNDLSDILGHSSLETTRLYTRTSDSQKRHNLERLKFS